MQDNRSAYPPQRVLVAEDNADVREVLATMLEHGGYVVETVGTGDAALQRLAESGGFSLLVADIGMPGTLDGWALADRAKAIRPELRVIYLTGYDLDPSKESPSHGPLLRKPCRPRELLDCVRRVLGTQHGDCSPLRP